MERDMLIAECRQITARLNDLHKALSNMDVQVAVEADAVGTCLKLYQAKQIRITVTYTQSL